MFLHTSPYVEPTYETRLQCNPGFAWRNAACALPSVSTIVKDRVAAATGIIVVVHDGHVSSCTGTLIAADLFLTARHCLNDLTGEDVRSASVTFDYATACDGSRPTGHVTRFFKVLDEALAPGPGVAAGLRSGLSYAVFIFGFKYAAPHGTPQAILVIAFAALALILFWLGDADQPRRC